MRFLHRESTGTSGRTALVINHSHATVAQARELLAMVEQKYGRDPER